MRWLVVGLMSWLVVCAGANASHASRSVLPSSSPGTGSPEALVKVMDLPRVSEFRRGNGTYLDLGYHWKADGTGEWVGHIGSDTEFLVLKPDMFPVLLVAAHLDEFPPVPERPVAPAGMAWLGFAALAVAGSCTYLWVRKRSKTTELPSPDELAPIVLETYDPIPAWTKRAMAEMQTAARRVTTSRTPVSNKRQSKPTVEAKPTRAAFGRR
jgi:hypothetical protein